ncbi:hypothetical protein [Serratia plymuthica]|uniref:hypothetical protein n=1 Tax=Serratia plymuthica TaxID=82996 RepID=UPI000EFFB782|nr:hypothetical protein [Serratia plymuthica]
MTREEIADYILFFKRNYACVKMAMMFPPDQGLVPLLKMYIGRDVEEKDRFTLKKRYGNCVFNSATRTLSGDWYSFNLKESIKTHSDNLLKRFDALEAFDYGIIVAIGQIFAEAGLYNISKEFQFFRHIRNGVAHGNTFTFNKKEPSQLAEFNGLVISKQLEGLKVLNAYGEAFINSGDLWELLDELEKQLRV